MSKVINSKGKYTIICEDGVYKIANVRGTIPPNHDCILDGWHIKDNKVTKEGSIKLIPNGTGEFFLRNFTVEANIKPINLLFLKKVSVSNSYFETRNGINFYYRDLQLFTGCFFDLHNSAVYYCYI